MKFLVMIFLVYSPLVFSFGGRSRRQESPQTNLQTESRIQCVNPIRGQSSPAISSLANNLQEVQSHEACRPLELGETRVTEGQALNGVAQNYSIKRTGPNRFEAGFTLNFIPNLQNPQAKPNMENKVRECFQGMRNVGASDEMGRIVDFKMYTPSEAQSLPESIRPPSVDITLNDEMEPNAGNYKSNFDCATIVHEIMHLMGIHDEYHNRRRADLVKRDPVTNQEIERIDYVTVARMSNEERTALLENDEYERIYHYNDCRAIIDAQTIMKNQNSFFPQTMPQFFRCKCENEGCKSKLKNLPAQKRNLIQKSQFLLTSIDNFREYCSLRQEDIVSSFISVNDSSVRDNETVTNLSVQGDQFSFTNTDYSFSEPDMRFRRTRRNYQCRCTEGETDCDVLRQTITRIAERGVFSQMHAICPYPSSHVDMNNVSAESLGNIDPRSEFIIINDSPGRIPMFRNAYVEKMIYPRCQSRAPKYEACTQYSYLRAGADCSSRPTYCGNSSWIDDIQ